MSRPASPVPHPKHLHLRGRFKFLEEAEVVLEVVTEVIDLPFEHSDALKSHSECESAVFLRVYAAGLRSAKAAISAKAPVGSKYSVPVWLTLTSSKPAE